MGHIFKRLLALLGECECAFLKIVPVVTAQLAHEDLLSDACLNAPRTSGFDRAFHQADELMFIVQCSNGSRDRSFVSMSARSGVRQQGCPVRSLSDTLSRLAKLKLVQPDPGGRGDRLGDLADFGSNPGNLRARIYVPDGLAEGAPLVVVMHGCTQNAASYDHGAGWSNMADHHGFALLFPEQRRSNNGNLCFNWFEPGDIRRGEGEALSIGQMIRQFCDNYGLDRSRVYINGLSAGGAMTAVMLATYPELFAGGAIIAGLPYGCASTVPQAFDRMRGYCGPDDASLKALVSRASHFEGPRPPLSIWHGTADMTVSPSNVDRIIGQWHGLLGIGPAPDSVEPVSGHRHAIWTRSDGTVALETFLISGMGHGTPIDPKGPAGCGAAGPFMLDVGLSSTTMLVESWGLATSNVAQTSALDATRRAPHDSPSAPRTSPRPIKAASPVTDIIENALRAAGLMR